MPASVDVASIRARAIESGAIDRWTSDADPATVSALADRLDDHLRPTSEGVRYQYETPAGVVVWDRADESPGEDSSGDGRSDAGRKRRS